MTKEEMLLAIYDKMADKTLSEGCKYITNKYNELDIFARCDDIIEGAIVQYHVPSESYSVVQNYTIIGHPICIGEVIKYIDSLETWLDEQWRQDVFRLLLLWKKRNLDLDKQSDECIEFVYNLIKK